MRINSRVTVVAELLLFGILGLCGTFAFTNSNAYTSIQDPLSSRFPTLSSYLPAIVWGVIFVFGVLSITLGSKGGGRLTWIVILFTLPSLLSFNSLNVLKLFGLELNLSTKLTFYQVLGLCIVIMTCYLLISFMSIFKHSRKSLEKRGASTDDIENVNSQSHFTLLLVTGSAVIAATIIALLSRSLESLTFSYLIYVPWNVVLIGLGCVMILAIYIYWLGSRRNNNP